MKIARMWSLLAALGVGLIEACSTDSSEGRSKAVLSPAPLTAPATAAADSAKTKPAAATAKAGAPCGPEFTEPALMQRAGRARVAFKGGGLSIDAVDAPAICGPLYNADVNALQVKAGDGLQFEACLPEGILQISSQTRAPGAQRVHTGRQPSGAEVTFEARDGETFSARGAPTDSIVFAPDLWKAEAELVLHAVDGTGRVQARLSIDCTGKGR